MAFINKNNPTAIDDYRTRLPEFIGKNKSESIYDSLLISYLATALFVIIDYFCLNSTWTTVDNGSSSSTMITLLSLGCAVILDLPMAIAGLVAKMASEKMCKKRDAKLVIALAITCFALVFIAQIFFRYVTRGDTFGATSSTLLEADEVSSNLSDTKVVTAALFAGIIPICTSIASFVITYFSSHPLKNKVFRIKKKIISVEANIIELKQCITEAGNACEHLKFLLAHETDAYNTFVDKVKSEGALRKQEVRNAIFERLSDPQQIAIIENTSSFVNEDVIDKELETQTEDILLEISNKE